MSFDDFGHPFLGYGDQQLIEALEYFGVTVSQWQAAYLPAFRAALEESFAGPDTQADGSVAFSSRKTLALYETLAAMAGVFALRACQPPDPAR